MTREERWLKKYQKLYKLDRWELKIQPVGSCPSCGDADALACVAVNHPYLRAKINLHSGYWELTAKQQEDTVRHEMVHLLTARMNHQAQDLLNGRLHTIDHLMEEWETVTEHLMRII